MKSSNNKGVVSSDVLTKFFLRKLFEENLIDADTYVIGIKMADAEFEGKNFQYGQYQGNLKFRR